MTPEALFVPVHVAAHRAGVTPSTVRRWLAEGRLQKYYIGITKRVVISAAELAAKLRVVPADDALADHETSRKRA